MSENWDKETVSYIEKYQNSVDETIEVKIALINSICDNLTTSEIVEILNGITSLEKIPDVLSIILDKLSKFNDKSSIDPLTDLLLMKNGAAMTEYLQVRMNAAVLIGNIKDTKGVYPLLYVLNNKHEHYKLRLLAAEALGRIGDKYAVAPLIQVVADEEEKSVYLRESAAKALGMLGDMRAISPLVSILEGKNGIMDKFTFLKERAIEALGMIGIKDDRALKALKNSLSDSAPYVRLGAIEALSEMDDPQVVPLIEKMLYDEEEDVARGAVCALYNIYGTDYIKELYDRPEIAGWCKDEIEEILQDEESELEEND